MDFLEAGLSNDNFRIQVKIRDEKPTSGTRKYNACGGLDKQYSFVVHTKTRMFKYTSSYSISRWSSSC